MHWAPTRPTRPEGGRAHGVGIDEPTIRVLEGLGPDARTALVVLEKALELGLDLLLAERSAQATTRSPQEPL